MVQARMMSSEWVMLVGLDQISDLGSQEPRVLRYPPQTHSPNSPLCRSIFRDLDYLGKSSVGRNAKPEITPHTDRLLPTCTIHSMPSHEPA